MTSPISGVYSIKNTKRQKVFNTKDAVIYFLYFEKRGDLIRIDSAIEKKWTAIQQNKPTLPQVMQIKENPREVELCLIWLWREFRVYPRRTWYKYQDELKQLIAIMPKVLPPHFTMEEIQRMYSLEYERAGSPTNSPYTSPEPYWNFIRNLTQKLFTRTEIAPEDTEIWEDVPDEFRYFAYKAAQVSNLGRIRWWREMMSEEIASEKKLKRRLLTLDHYHYAKTQVYNDNLCVTVYGKSPCQVRKIVLAAFRGEDQEGLVINHLNGNQLDCRLENLTYLPAQKISSRRKKHLSEVDKQAIRNRCAFNQKHGHPIKVNVLAAEYGVTVRTIYRVLQSITN